MSKGCVVGLIVVGVIAVLIIVGGAVCWIYKDDLARMPVKTVVAQMQTYLSENEVEGVDPDVFNTVADDFLQRIESEDPLQFEKYGEFITSIQTVSSRQEYTADDYDNVMAAMITYYPELADHVPPEVDESLDEMEDMGAMEDTVTVE